MRIEAAQGMSGNSTPRPRKRTSRLRVTLTARMVGALKPEEKCQVALRSPSPTAGRDLVPKVTTCPCFVRNAVPCADGTRNPAGFLGFLLHPQNRLRQPSSSRKRIESTWRPWLTSFGPTVCRPPRSRIRSVKPWQPASAARESTLTANRSHPMRYFHHPSRRLFLPSAHGHSASQSIPTPPPHSSQLPTGAPARSRAINLSPPRNRTMNSGRRGAPKPRLSPLQHSGIAVDRNLPKLQIETECAATPVTTLDIRKPTIERNTLQTSRAN